MKTIKITLFAILLAMSVGAQEAIQVGFYQDAKLALLKDDHGNKPFTADVITRIGLQGKQQKLGFMAILLELEYAQLFGGDYTRYSAGVQYNFNYMPIPYTGCRKYYTISFSAQFGWIARPGTTFTGVFNMDISVKGKDVWKHFPEGLNFTWINQGTIRTDLPNGKLGYSFLAGMDYKFDI